MKAILNVYVRSKTDEGYVDHGGQCVVGIFESCDNPPKDDYFLMREIERMAIDKFLGHVADKSWIVLYKDLLDIEVEAVLVNLAGYEAIDVDVVAVLSEKDYEQAHLRRLEYEVNRAEE